ncbi:MAG: asparagine synthase-related protein [Pseudomonadota bacterium]|nr:asparagine synthase-related protein [Pseudomonadota bacterium]
MSGFAVIYNQSDHAELEKMFQVIGHRGPYLSGKFASKQVLMAQNYLKADLCLLNDDFPEPDENQIPVFNSKSPDIRICYDGQLGNWSKLAEANGVADGPLREERLFLQLYKQYGQRMFDHLDDAIFAFVISDGKNLFAARDLLGIKTLFYGRKNGTLYLSSELKSLVGITDDIHEFPPGHYMDNTGTLFRFAELPRTTPEVLHRDVNEITATIRDIIQRSFQNRIHFDVPTASLLSGGVDSSVIAWIAGNAYRETFGKNERLKTFALGVGETEDIACARIMADHIGSDHHELIVDLDQILAALPEVVRQLESFDPSLVRSSVSNYLISKYAQDQGVETLLSGEGGDEIFCGYLYLKDFPSEEIFTQQMRCIGFLHSNASLRLDRMNLSHSIRVVAPLISGELFNYVMGIPAEYKQKPEGDQKIEKWIFRKAYEKLLPEKIVWRLKQEFSQGSGSADVLPEYFETAIKDKELKEVQAGYPMVRSKEELYYFKIFTEHFGKGQAVETVGQWVCL